MNSSSLCFVLLQSSDRDEDFGGFDNVSFTIELVKWGIAMTISYYLTQVWLAYFLNIKWLFVYSLVSFHYLLPDNVVAFTFPRPTIHDMLFVEVRFQLSLIVQFFLCGTI